jgi:hypothetical protein
MEKLKANRIANIYNWLRIIIIVLFSLLLMIGLSMT